MNFHDPADVQQDSLKQVKLEKELKLKGTKQELEGAEDGASAALIAKNGRFVETALFWLTIQQLGQVGAPELKQLLTILVAQLNFRSTIQTCCSVGEGTF